MKFNKCVRILVCLLLVCALVINISPIKGKALAIEASTLWVLAKIVITSLLAGLGIYAASQASTFFQDLVSSAEEELTAAGYVVGGMMQVTALTNGNFRYGVKQGVIDFLRNWCWEQDIVYEPHKLITGETPWTSKLSGQTYIPRDSYLAFEVSYTTDTCATGARYYTEILILSSRYYDLEGVTSTSYNAPSTTYNGKQFWYIAPSPKYTKSTLLPGCLDLGNMSGSEYNSDAKIAAVVTVYAMYSQGLLPTVDTDHDLKLGYVAPQNMTLAQGYADWRPISVYDDDEQEQIIYPLGIGQTQEETQELTQEQIWAGESTYAQEQEQGQVTQQGFASAFSQLFNKLGTWFGQLFDTLISIPGQILDGLGQILTNVLSYLFVPQQDFVQTKVQTLTQEFSFASALVTTGKAITSGLSGIATEPPIIYIDLSANRGSHYLGGRTVFMDLSWYAEYKPTVDTLISAFLWICFVWRMLLKLPGIIGGMPGDFVYGAAHTLGLDNHLPTRNAAYEVTRAANREYIRKGPGK